MSQEVDHSNDTKSNEILEKYGEAYQKNSDLARWIKIEDTNINYPVMLTREEQDFYLHHGFNKISRQELLCRT